MESCTTDRLEARGRALVEHLGGRWSGHGGLCLCPAHEDRRPSLSIRVGRTNLLLHCFAGCSAADVLSALRRDGIPVARGEAPGEAAGRGTVRDASGSSGAAVRLWRKGVPIGGTPAGRYLAGRGIFTGSPELRFHRRAPLGPRPLTRFLPALLAAVRDETGLVAVHRTFLAPDGRLAPIDAPRRGLGPLGSGCVRLGAVAPILGLAEGIETALAASRLFGLPCWATLGTERFGRVRLPSGVRTLVLLLDSDRGGRRAEALARQAFAHLSIECRYPRREGADWNDVLLGRHARGAT